MKFYQSLTGEDIIDYETRIVKEKDQYRKGDFVIVKDKEVIKRLKSLFGIELNSEAIKHIVIDFTMSHQIKHLTIKGKNPGKVWKQCHSGDRLLLIVNIDPDFTLNIPVIFDSKLQDKMRDLGIPNQENVRFIRLDDFAKIFNMEPDIFKDIKLKITESKTSEKALKELAFRYYEALAYLSEQNIRYGVGWRILKDLPF